VTHAPPGGGPAGASHSTRVKDGERDCDRNDGNAYANNAEAKRLADRLEIHHTPKHGSWLNMAEIELGILQRQCLDRRLGDPATMTSDFAAWVTARNAVTQRFDWRFTTADTHIKLKRLYPTHDD